MFSGCGKSIRDTIDEITSGATAPAELPFITVLTSGNGNFYSLNNRRLYVLKYLRANGYLEPSNTIRVRLKTPLPRELKKYSPDKCSLTASIMKERPVKPATAEPSNGDLEKDSEQEGNECGDLADKFAESSLSGADERDDNVTNEERPRAVEAHSATPIATEEGIVIASSEASSNTSSSSRIDDRKFS